MTFINITSAGAGQMAFHGKHVIVYDAIPAGLERGKAFHRENAEHFIKQLRASTVTRIRKGRHEKHTRR